MPDFTSDRIRWLHLSDIHVGNNSEAQQTALHSLIEAIAGNARDIAFDFILITGDIAYSGNASEYQRAGELLIKPLRLLSTVGQSVPIYATPGNHDLDCDVEPPISWKDLGRSRQEKFFTSTAEGQRIRGSRPKGFGGYAKFVSDHGLLSVDPVTAPATVFELNAGGKSLRIISVVTSYFSDREVSDQRRSPAPLLPIRSLLQKSDSSVARLIIGHHPPDWFLPESEQPFHSLLVESNAIYLHGHEHRIRSKFGVRGLTSLGFGAAYQAPADSSPTPYYRNSFAICELTDALHVAVYSWDSENGQWRSEQQLPGDFADKSERLVDGYRLTIPQSKLTDRTRPLSAVAAAVRTDFEFEKCLWLVDGNVAKWTEVLVSIGLLRNVGERYELAGRQIPAGHVQFRIRDGSAQYLIYAVSGYGDVLNYEQLQSINTDLDRQDYAGGIVLTLGTLSNDARTLASQLRAKKSIEVLERSDLIRRISRTVSSGLERAFRRAVDANLKGSLIVREVGLAAVLQDRSSPAIFQVLDNDGAVLPEADHLVLRIRSEVSSLQGVRYDSSGSFGGIPGAEGALDLFDKANYLKQCYAFFDDVKYAPLAALGFRFKKASLSQIYLDASADVGGENSTARLTRAVAEFVESLNLPRAQQDQLSLQLQNEYGLNRSAEVGAARKLYQRYNNVVVVGDPGSGKTCFVQHEILAYSAPDLDVSGWYSQHLPVYVSLSEAARLLDGNTSLTGICEIVSARRGITLPKRVVEDALSEGRAAIFFDGLDEVGLLDKRIALVNAITELVDSYAHRGSRFILASRPAAVQPVSIPDALTSLHLKGLTEDEIRILAKRVLASRLGDEVSDTNSEDTDDLVDKLLDDVQKIPGIARIARNPLLLTLLVLIYATSGTVSARRHIIYTQAVKTLVSVRGRDTREQQLSETDLRLRLGAIALGIFKREIAELPRRSEVISILAPLVNRPGATRSGIQAAEAFIQEVAEATGLLVIHARDGIHTDDLITFMHYSFLEYYAAAGLLTQDYLNTVPQLAGNARWRDVVTLLFGLLSEQGDVTPLIKRVLEPTNDSESITQYRTILALDCALECDVPPELTQSILAASVLESLTSGAARYSAELRVDFADRLGDLLTPNSIVEDALCQGLQSPAPVTAAAFADMIARIAESTPLTDAVIRSFWQAAAHAEAVSRISFLFAIESRRELQTDEATAILHSALRQGVVEKHAALKVVDANPRFLDSTRAEVLKLLDDTNGLVSAAAAQCLLMQALRSRHAQSDSTLIERSLRKLEGAGSDETGMTLRGLTLDKSIVQELIMSSDSNDSELALRHIRMVKDEAQFVYELVTRKLRDNPGPRLLAACLDALRESTSSIDLVTLADTDLICSLVTAEHRNIRIAAVRLLAEMPGDQQVVETLQGFLGSCAAAASRDDELLIAARALANHIRKNPRIRIASIGGLLGVIPRKAEDGFGSPQQQTHIVRVLTVLEYLGELDDPGLAWRIRALADDYRTPDAIRKQAIYTFGSLAAPEEREVKELVLMLNRDDIRVNEAVFAATSTFLARARRKIDHVRQIFNDLVVLRDALVEAWRREEGRSHNTISPVSLRNIRGALIETNNQLMAYQEFAKSEK